MKKFESSKMFSLKLFNSIAISSLNYELDENNRQWNCYHKTVNYISVITRISSSIRLANANFNFVTVFYLLETALIYRRFIFDVNFCAQICDIFD